MRNRPAPFLMLAAALVAAACRSTGPPGTTGASAVEAEAPADGVRAFVRQTFIHGVPYEQARRFDDDEDVATLLEMLRDPAEAEHWANVVVTLCMIGDERCVEPVIDFITAPVEGTLAPTAYAARTSAIMSLGYVVNARKDPRALRFLAESSAPSTWSERKLAWKSPHGVPDAQRDRELATMAILGLSLAGTPAAHQELQRLLESKEEVPFYRSMESLLRQAEETCSRIQRDGLATYYRETKH